MKYTPKIYILMTLLTKMAGVRLGEGPGRGGEVFKN